MRNLCIVGLQWGDEGKGKIVDYYADRFDAVVRFNGGSNAGHTIVIGNKSYVFHLLPSGSLQGKELLIGPGVALDPLTLKDELELLAKEGMRANLLIDGRCTVVTPFEKEMDAFLEGMRGSSAIGTTRRGIGPSYAMRALRLTPRAADLASGEFDATSAAKFYGNFLKELSDLSSWREESRRVLEGRMGDVGERVMELNEGGKNVLFEGAQGVLLDLIFGTYPYVTGAHTVATYVPAGLGIPNGSLGGVMGVAKAYTTRVGSGPFPTEIEDETAKRIRDEGKEYGATTGRPRRIGWLDIVGLRYATRTNGVEEIALTKLDILAKVKETKVCVAYSIDGSEVTEFSRALPHLDEARPVYQEMPSLFGAELGSGRLPRPAEKLVEYLEEELRARVSVVSLGEERSATVKR